MKKTESHIGEAVAITAGVVALSAAGYFLFGPNGKKNRKEIKGWTLRAKGELLEKIEGMEVVTAEGYKKAVEQVTKKYATLKSVTPEELKKLGDEMLKHWRAIERDHAPKKATKKGGKKAVSKKK